MVSVYRTQ